MRCRNIIWTLSALAAMLLLAACGGAHEAASPVQTPVQSSTAAPADCAALVGKPFPKDFNGCTERGVLYAWSTLDCKDGSSLVIVGNAPGYFGRTNKGVVASGDINIAATGTPYANAQQACFQGK